MVVSTKSAITIGLNVHIIDVEIDTINSIPQVAIIGLPDTAISEAKERLRLAIKNSGYSFPSTKVVINLAPANIKKEGVYLDLPICVAILHSTGQIVNDELGDYLLVGELALDGTLRSATGVLPMVLCARENGIHNVIVPVDKKKK